MVDEKDILKQYSYKATSNLVIPQNRKRRQGNPSGVGALEADSLPGRMGDRALPAEPKKPSSQPEEKPNQEIAPQAEAPGDVLEAIDSLEVPSEGFYRPTTFFSQRAYEALLAFVSSKIGDQPRDVVRAVAEEVLATVKDGSLIPAERNENLGNIFSIRLTDDDITRIGAIARGIRDYGEGTGNDENALGFAVDFDDEEDDAQQEVQHTDIVVEREPDTMMDGDVPQKLYSIKEQHPTQRANGDSGTRIGSLKWLRSMLDNKSFREKHGSLDKLTDSVLETLSLEENERVTENRLVELLGLKRPDIIADIVDHKQDIIQNSSSNRKELEPASNGEVVLPSESGGRKESRNEPILGKKRARASSKRAQSNCNFAQEPPFQMPYAAVDLASLSVSTTRKLVGNRKFSLPEGSEHIENKDYEEWHIPAPRPSPEVEATMLVSITTLPVWAHRAFPSTRTFNRMQSQVFPAAFETANNLLLCAPTGAGKTNVAVLTILKAIGDAGMNEEGRAPPAETCKVVYVAPMKALVAEVVENLSRRLGPLGISVRELTGDVSLSSIEIRRTHLIVTTPEKWDIVSRKSANGGMLDIRLLIIDEIHLLHDDRGPVLESIIARTKGQLQAGIANTRMVGLSATLPNCKDVASFLGVVEGKGLFYFDSSHRPCPLQQCFVGITSRRALKRFQLQNELTYEKVKLQIASGNQVIVFVHSRKETASTCRYMIEKAIEEEIADQFLRPTSGSYEVIQQELPAVISKDLADVLEQGCATHHAGLARSDRELVEALFQNGHVKILVSTATLAWGVNLPAHAVIIKGTQVYSPEHGRWVQLSPMDVLQMMGRAGRPQFDTYGEGFIITSKTDVMYYLSLLNDQLPIESQLITRLIDLVNAEVAAGTVLSVQEGAQWVQQTYFDVRMREDPVQYGILTFSGDKENDFYIRRASLIHSAFRELHKSGLAVYRERAGEICSTDLGRLAADFYVGHQTMEIFTEHIASAVSEVELLNIFSMAGEFQHIRVREEEKLELSRLAERVPIPIKEGLHEPTAKVNVLLQAFISGLGLDGLALRADMAYITQSAARLTRALLHVALELKKAVIFEKCLNMSKAVHARQWTSQTPLRQFGEAIEAKLLYKIERKDIPFERYYDLKIAEIGELVKNQNVGKKIYRMVHNLPRLHIEVEARPVTRSTLRLYLSITPDFLFDRRVHGAGEWFWIIVEDGDSENILHAERFYVRSSMWREEHNMVITVELASPRSPQLFIRTASDQWIVPDNVVSVALHDMILPEKFDPHVTLEKNRSLSAAKAFEVSDEREADDKKQDEASMEALSNIKSYFKRQLKVFPPLVAAAFPALFHADGNVVIGNLPNSERDICGELCISRLFSRYHTANAVWVVGRGDFAVERVYQNLSKGVAKYLGLRVIRFLQDKAEDISPLRESGVIAVTTAESWDKISRRWRQKKEGKIIRKIGLVVLDGLNLVASSSTAGAALEVVASRMRYIGTNSEGRSQNIRIVALCDPVANARDLGQWLGAPSSSVFSFDFASLIGKLKITTTSVPFRGSHDDIVASLGRIIYSALSKDQQERKTIVFASSCNMAESLSKKLAQLRKQNSYSHTLHQQGAEYALKVSNPELSATLLLGVAYCHEGLNSSDLNTVEKSFEDGSCTILFTTCHFAWLSDRISCSSVIIAGTTYHEDARFAYHQREYSTPDLLRMLTRAILGDDKAKASRLIIITDPTRRSYYEKKAFRPPPVESSLVVCLPDHLNAEIASKVIQTKQDAVDYLTWTLFYRRLPKNPNFYGLKDLSNEAISSHLSELVETALSDLEKSKCVAVEGSDDVALGALNLGFIASHHYVRHETVELFASSIVPRTRIGGILDILCFAWEFRDMPCRDGDDELIEKIGGIVKKDPVSDGNGDLTYSSPAAKAHILLQAHMNRVEIPSVLQRDQERILLVSVRLLRAMVDVISSAGWMTPALEAIDLCQMLVQGVWDEKVAGDTENEYSLMQLPHVDKQLAALLREKYDVSNIHDFLGMEDEDRSEALKGLKVSEIAEMAQAGNSFPDLNMDIGSVESFGSESEVVSTRVVIGLDRNDESSMVSAPRYPVKKQEGWWVIIGHAGSNSLLSLKHVTLKQRLSVKTTFDRPVSMDEKELTVYLLSDCYVGADLEESFVVHVSKVQ